MQWSDMLSHVLPSVTGCPDQLAIDHLVKAARTFCARTLVWNYSTVPISATAGLATYTLQIGQGTELVRLLGADVDGTLYDVPSGITGRRAQREKQPNTCVMTGNADFRLEPAPHIDGLEIITDVAVKPSLVNPADWPDDLEDHVSELAYGAIASLCELPNTTWTDDKTAEREGAKFRDRINTVAFKVSKGFGRSRHHAAIQWF